MRARLRAGEVENGSLKMIELNCTLMEMGK